MFNYRLVADQSAKYSLRSEMLKLSVQMLNPEPCEKNLHLAEKAIGNGELNNRVNIWQWRALGSCRGPSLAEALRVLNRLSGCWVIVDREIRALWT